MRFMLLAAISFLSLSAFSESAYEAANRTAWENEAISEQVGSETKDLAEKFKRAMSGYAGSAGKRAQSLAEAARSHAVDANAFNSTPEDVINAIRSPGKVYVFVSSSMPKGQIISLYRSLSRTPLNVEVAYRGLFPGNRTLIDFSRQAGKILRDSSDQVNAIVGLNPTAFREFGIDQVPCLVFISESGEPIKQYGSVNVSDFFDSVSRGEPIISPIGATFEIAERDLIEEIQDRMSSINWQEKIGKAKDRYWERNSPKSLPTGVEESKLSLDMSVRVEDDISADANGKHYVIARKGEVFNPMLQPMMSQYNRRIIVLNPNEDRQVAWAKGVVEDALSRNLKPVVMLSELLSGDKWDTFGKLEKELLVSIYTLPDVVVDRFSLSSVPVVIEPSLTRGFMDINYIGCDGSVCGK